VPKICVIAKKAVSLLPVLEKNAYFETILQLLAGRITSNGRKAIKHISL